MLATSTWLPKVLAISEIMDGFSNAKLFIDYAEYYGRCIASSYIKAGSEIFIDYGPNYIFREGKNSIRE